MGDRTLHYSWRWDMPASPQHVWPLVSDTHAFNRATGVGPWTFTETPDPSGGSVREGARRSRGPKITWDEKPFDWVEGREFSVLRVFHRGPFLWVLARLELEPVETGSTLTYSIEAVPRSFLGSVIGKYYLGVQTRRQFHRVFSGVAKYLSGEMDVAYPSPEPSLAPGSQTRLLNGESSLIEAGFGQSISQLLTRYVKEASDDACHRLKPYVLADMWGEDRETVLRLCMHATRLGFLDLGWDLMCPFCRGAKERVSSLSELRGRGHCPSCNIQFDANFDRAVEVTFTPSQQIRQLQVPDYCVGGPGNTPHIVVQQSLPPGESVNLPIDLADGVYRLRGPQMSATAILDVGPDFPATETVRFSCDRSGVAPQRTEVAGGRTGFCIHNASEDYLVVMLERMQWPEDAVTAAQVTALQDFRDLFSSEVLAPEEQFQVRYLTFMFTDLKSSTSLYRGKGDAPAYALVRDHFQVLRECVAENHGAVVKTIGDSIMAVFREPGDAVAAGLGIHKAFGLEASRYSGLVLKIGVHPGPCIAVNLNGRLDYFGTTVNTAVRLESHSLGGDVVVRADLLEDPMVSAVLGRPGIHIERLRVELKGFEEPAEICRITWEGDAGETESQEGAAEAPSEG